MEKLLNIHLYWISTIITGKDPICDTIPIVFTVRVKFINTIIIVNIGLNTTTIAYVGNGVKITKNQPNTQWNYWTMNPMLYL